MKMALPEDAVPSSSPAFATPAVAKPSQRSEGRNVQAPILPVHIPPATLRPVAFRTFTKKYDLTLSTGALQELAKFVGKYCGTGWREDGLAEKVLEEFAKAWKAGGGALIVDGSSKDFKDIYVKLEKSMVGGKVSLQALHGAAATDDASEADGLTAPGMDQERDSMPNPEATSNGETGSAQLSSGDPKQWLKVIGAFEQPRLHYNPTKRNFEKVNGSQSLFPDVSSKSSLFKNRYHVVHQRLLRNEAFQAPAVAPSRGHSLQRSASTITEQQSYKITPVSNLLGRGGSSHVLFGMLTRSPTGSLALSDPSGSVLLDLEHARAIPEDGAFFVPGMMVIVDGIYEEGDSSADQLIGVSGGVAGMINGKVVGLSVGGPPCERRELSLGIGELAAKGGSNISGANFGWVDFLGVGSHKSTAARMENMEGRVLNSALSERGRSKIVILGETNLDSPQAIQALKKICGAYTTEFADPPIAFVLVGNFSQKAVMAGGADADGVEYKEHMNSLASALSEFPSLLSSSTFIFIPGDNDPWASTFASGAATNVPRHAVPDLFTSRIKRTFASNQKAAPKSETVNTGGEALWTTNPARLSLFGNNQEIVLFRDNMLGRLRRNALQLKGSDSAPAEERGEVAEADSSLEAGDVDMKDLEVANQEEELASKDDVRIARKLVKTVLDQGFLSPFPLSTRPVLWDHASALHLYPLPTALVLADPEAPSFALTYEGCHVMNPGRLLHERKRGLAGWIEYDASTRRGRKREINF